MPQSVGNAYILAALIPAAASVPRGDAGGGPTVLLYCELDGYSGSGQYRVDHSHACATQSLDLREGMREFDTGSSLENYGMLCDALELYVLKVASYVQEY